MATTDIDLFDLESMTTSKFEVGLAEKDMITKRPVAVGNWLIIQGRLHIHMFNIKTKESRALYRYGEDKVEDE